MRLLIILITLISTIYVDSLLSQVWTPQTSGVTNELYSVHFVNQNVGWAVGGSGKIIKTTNVNLNETELNFNDKLLVKPNPTTGLSTIEIESESLGRLTLKLLDLQGREVQKFERLKSGKALSLQLDGTNLAQGTYTLQLIIENQLIATTNLIIQK